ncbi:hypothetical protein KKF34_01400 [Myxococcota bacterium]|nr:hypothetical protein [Myxococcota bacterium]MBU1380058.1 hypothetical protein [Myxococcota bacterium]MBU1495516.1 hypothetical protein [Myxococcota bacterium]
MKTFEFTSPVRLKPTVKSTLEEKLVYSSKNISSVTINTVSEGKPLITVVCNEDTDTTAVQKTMEDLIRGFSRGFLEIEKEILFDRSDVSVPGKTDVYDEMKEQGWVFEYETGRVMLNGSAARLYDFFDREFVKIAEQYNASPVNFPTLISVDTLKKADYFASFPHHITLATHLVEDPEKITAFSEAYSGDKDLDLTEVSEKTAHVCSPAVCFHLYQALEGQNLDKVVRKTAIGPCFRYESSNMKTLERLWDFHMREIIFVGPVNEVDELRLSAMEPVMNFVDAIGLRSHIETASDPFFVNNYSGQTFYQLSHKTKYELRLYLPYKEDHSLAAASFNWHQSFFGNRFQINAGENESGTACVAFGVERWVYAFCCQFGLDPDNWPSYVLENW